MGSSPSVSTTRLSPDAIHVPGLAFYFSFLPVFIAGIYFVNTSHRIKPEAICAPGFCFTMDFVPVICCLCKLSPYDWTFCCLNTFEFIVFIQLIVLNACVIINSNFVPKGE